MRSQFLGIGCRFKLAFVTSLEPYLNLLPFLESWKQVTSSHHVRTGEEAEAKERGGSTEMVGHCLCDPEEG